MFKKIIFFIEMIRIDAHLAKMSVAKMLTKKMLCLPTDIIQKMTFCTYNKLNLKWTKTPMKMQDYAANWLSFVITFTERVRIHIWLGKSENTYKDLCAHGPLF